MENTRNNTNLKAITTLANTSNQSTGKQAFTRQMVMLAGIVLAATCSYGVAQECDRADLFLPFTTFPVGGEAFSSAVADMDGNGLLDIIVAGWSSSSPAHISVLLNGGSRNNRFDQPVVTNTERGIGDFAVGYLNDDNFSDIAIAQPLSGTVGVLLGRGDGSFLPVVNFWPGGNNPTWVAIDDMNNDQNLDIVVLNRSSDALGILYGDGLGGFSIPQIVSIGANLNGFTIGDLDNDGYKDIAVTGNGISSEGVYVVFGSNSGIFSLPDFFPTGFLPFGVSIADLDNDNDMDIVVANKNSHTVSVLVGDGSRDFAAAVNFATGRDPISVRIGDMDLDGHQDLVVSSAADGEASVLFGDGLNNFNIRESFQVEEQAVVEVAIGDLDNDGDLDMVSADSFRFSRTVSTLMNRCKTPSIFPGTLFPFDEEEPFDNFSTDTDIERLFGNGVFVSPGSVTLRTMTQGDWIDEQTGLPIVASSGTQFAVGFGFGDFTLDFTAIGGINGFSGMASAAGVGDDIVEFFDMGGSQLGRFEFPGGFGNGDGTMELFSFASTETVGSVRLTGSRTAYDDLGYAVGNLFCSSDLNNDGALNFFDISAFLTAFSARDPIADITQDEIFNFFDVIEFLSAFVAGCP